MVLMLILVARWLDVWTNFDNETSPCYTNTIYVSSVAILNILYSSAIYTLQLQ